MWPVTCVPQRRWRSQAATAASQAIHQAGSSGYKPRPWCPLEGYLTSVQPAFIFVSIPLHSLHERNPSSSSVRNSGWRWCPESRGTGEETGCFGHRAVNSACFPWSHSRLGRQRAPWGPVSAPALLPADVGLSGCDWQERNKLRASLGNCQCFQEIQAPALSCTQPFPTLAFE